MWGRSPNNRYAKLNIHHRYNQYHTTTVGLSFALMYWLQKVRVTGFEFAPGDNFSSLLWDFYSPFIIHDAFSASDASIIVTDSSSDTLSEHDHNHNRRAHQSNKPTDCDSGTDRSCYSTDHNPSEDDGPAPDADDEREKPHQVEWSDKDKATTVWEMELRSPLCSCCGSGQHAFIANGEYCCPIWLNNRRGVRLCQFFHCKSYDTHVTRMCTWLHAVCDVCFVRGHDKTDGCQTWSDAEWDIRKSEWELAARNGLYTSKRTVNWGYGFFYHRPWSPYPFPFRTYDEIIAFKTKDMIQALAQYAEGYWPTIATLPRPPRFGRKRITPKSLSPTTAENPKPSSSSGCTAEAPVRPDLLREPKKKAPKRQLRLSESSDSDETVEIGLRPEDRLAEESG